MALIKKDSPAEKEVKTEDIASENAIQEKVETQKATITLTPEELKNGIVTASSGNHGRGVAYAAKMLGVKQPS